MVKLEKYVGDKTYMFPNGALADKDAMLRDFPTVLTFPHVIHTDEGGEVCFGVYNLSAMCAQHSIDRTLPEADRIAALEDAMNAPLPEPAPSAEERIAAALEYQNLVNM
ncbi:hypothetical protein [Intestinibacillus massiliensis]|uniref:hypothetical protein n=1 Tax=Intestinibacillus massiliensis TaxID=1871029 RepID=UPI000B35F709|nr:hypothetical protein [Intestinibacillus massiliensis]